MKKAKRGDIMADKKPKDPPPTDIEGYLYRKDYAPGLAHFLRELTDEAERTFLECMKQGLLSHGDFPKRLKILLDENLRKKVSQVFGLPSLSALSFIAHREASTYPPSCEAKETKEQATNP